MRKCIVITTIYPPTPTIKKYSQLSGYDLIIVADRKTPVSEYSTVTCIMLSLELQYKLFPSLASMIPENSYARKNIGYAYAIREKYDVIYETDDDNVPDDDWPNVPQIDIYTVTGPRVINIYKLFTEQHIWPRGLPLNLIKDDTQIIIERTNVYPAILQGLVDNDPDVDAICRLTNSILWTPFFFDKRNVIYTLKDCVCPGNTQNTMWLNSMIFYLLYIPSTVSFRYCDIIRTYVAQVLASSNHNMSIGFTDAHVTQLRNPHDLMKDFTEEIPVYQTVGKLLEILDGLCRRDGTTVSLDSVYERLFIEGIVDAKEVLIVKEWLKIVCH